MTHSENTLSLGHVTAGYGDMTVLRAVSFEANAGTVTAVAGANGAGKTTLLKTTLGILPATAGAIRFQGQDITRLSAAKRIALGMGLVPEGRGLFGTMSVSDNLRLGGRAGGLRGATLTGAITRVFDVFPVLADKKAALAGSLSGGQQQMLSLARVLVARPQLILLDEPSMGLAPKVWLDFLTLARTLADDGSAVVLAEQKIRPVLDISERCIVLQRGVVVFEGEARSATTDQAITSAYLEAAPTREEHYG